MRLGSATPYVGEDAGIPVGWREFSGCPAGASSTDVGAPCITRSMARCSVTGELEPFTLVNHARNFGLAGLRLPDWLPGLPDVARRAPGSLTAQREGVGAEREDQDSLSAFH